MKYIGEIKRKLRTGWNFSRAVRVAHFQVALIAITFLIIILLIEGDVSLLRFVLVRFIPGLILLGIVAYIFRFR